MDHAEQLERVLLDLSASIHRAFAALEQTMMEGFARIEAKFDAQGARMDREAAGAQAFFDKLENRYGSRDR